MGPSALRPGGQLTEARREQALDSGPVSLDGEGFRERQNTFAALTVSLRCEPECLLGELDSLVDAPARVIAAAAARVAARARAASVPRVP